MRRIVKVTIIVALLVFVVAGCRPSRKELLTTLTNEIIASEAESLKSEYLPLKDGYFATLTFTLPGLTRENWIDEDFTETKCDVFDALYDGDYINNEWWARIDKATCYGNSTVTENELAAYNELTIMLFDEEILLYAAGTTQPPLN